MVFSSALLELGSTGAGGVTILGGAGGMLGDGLGVTGCVTMGAGASGAGAAVSLFIGVARLSAGVIEVVRGGADAEGVACGWCEFTTLVLSLLKSNTPTIRIAAVNMLAMRTSILVFDTLPLHNRSMVIIIS